MTNAPPFAFLHHFVSLENERAKWELALPRGLNGYIWQRLVLIFSRITS